MWLPAQTGGITCHAPIEAFAKGVQTLLGERFKHFKSEEPANLKVHGRKAIRYDMIFDDGTVDHGCVVIYLETATRWICFSVIGPRATFDKAKDDWAKLAEGLTEN